jgi:hypothetical protein
MQRGDGAATKEITMNSSSPSAWRPTDVRHPAHEAFRQWAARQLRNASVAMAHLAGQLAAPATAPTITRDADTSHREFSTEAGAPEGALFLDGRLVGWVPGVTRL